MKASVSTETTTAVAGVRVNGKANVGDVVTYFDIANQDGTEWTVIEVPQRTPQGFMSNYVLRATEPTVRHRETDLRQRGWTFVSIEVQVVTLASSAVMI